MIKLKTFIALLIPIGLLPNFQGSSNEEPENERSENKIAIDLGFYKEVMEVAAPTKPNQQPSPTKQPLDGEELFMEENKIKERITMKIDSGSKVSDIINRAFDSLKKRNNKDAIIKLENYTIWKRNIKFHEITFNRSNSYLKLNKEDRLTVPCFMSIDILVKGEDEQNLVASLFNAPTDDTNNTGTTITATQPPAPSPAPSSTGDTNTDTDTDIEDHSNNDINNNNDTDTTTKSKNTSWTTARIVLGVAGGLAFLFTLSGTVYYFVLPEKATSLLLQEEEEEEEGEYDFEL